MEPYLIKSSIALAVFYLLYRFLLYNYVSHQWKRFSGNVIILFCVLFVFIPSFELRNTSKISQDIGELIESTSNLAIETVDLQGPTISVGLVVYLIGVGFFSLRFFFNLFSVIRLLLKSSKSEKWGFKIIELEQSISPFSFFNYLFIKKGYLNEEHIAPIITHEQYHKDQFHSFDVIFLEVMCILFWFNPFMWFFKKDVKASHEFVADEFVIKQGYDQLDYQNLLFKARTGILFRTVNYLNNRTGMKQRINVMKNSKINLKRSYLSLSTIFVGMVLTVLISSFSSANDFMQDIDLGQIKVYNEDGELNLKEGISKDTKKLLVRIVPKEDDKNDAYRITKIKATLVSDGLGRGTATTGDLIDLEPIFSRVQKESQLVLEIQEYQTRNKDLQVFSTIVLEKPKYINIAIKL